MKPISPIFPLYFDNEGGYASNKTIKQVVKQNLKNLVLTSPGERIMIPNFGVGIRNYLFQQNIEKTIERIESKIRQQVGLFMPFVEIQGFSSISEENHIELAIQYFIIPLEEADILSVRL